MMSLAETQPGSEPDVEGEDCIEAWQLGQRVWNREKRWEGVVTLTAVEQERSGHKRAWKEDDRRGG